jgi:6-phosphofructokinase 1
VGASTAAADAGGNAALPEIGPYFKDVVNRHFKRLHVPVNVKYIDPSYMIRSVPANASDSMLCMLLAQVDEPRMSPG